MANVIAIMPANIELSGMEVSLVNAMSRKKILKQYLDGIKHQYDYVLLDCMPSLGMLTVNALAAADSVLIPVQAQYLPAKGLEQQFAVTVGGFPMTGGVLLAGRNRKSLRDAHHQWHEAHGPSTQSGDCQVSGSPERKENFQGPHRSLGCPWQIDGETARWAERGSVEH